MNPTLLILALLSMLILFGVATGFVIFFFQKYLVPDLPLIQQRLLNLRQKQGQSGDDTDEDGINQYHLLYKNSGYKYELLNKYLSQFSFYTDLKLKLQQANMNKCVDVVLLNFFIVPIGIGFLLMLITQFFPLIFVGCIVPAFYYTKILLKRNSRFQAFITLLPDSLSMMTSALKAGHSFQSALTVVASEMPDPISSEFSIMVTDISLGITTKEALSRMTYRMNALPDIKMFSTAINIQREAGGNLAEILENLSETIRERFKLKGQIASLTGQSRLTGYVLGGAPCFLLLFLSIFLYGYVQPLYETEWGHMALLVALVMQVIGFLVMQKIIDIRV